MKIAASWSGGKESCYACYKAISSGFNVAYLLNFISEDDGRIMSHGLRAEVVSAQSQAIGIPVIQHKTTWDAYEEGFKAAVDGLKGMGVEGVVFGDIDIQEHRDWAERVCGECGVEPLEPLWGVGREQILTDLIHDGFEAVLVNAKADIFGEEWLGRKIDDGFLRDLRELQAKCIFDLCGESGEYHTFVVDGPIFKKRLRVLDSNKVLREGYWRHWLLDISGCELVEKGVPLGGGN